MDATMDRPRLLVGLLRRLGAYSVKTFSDRLVLQKTVYLLQVFGIYLGYRFSWYLRGPYSTELTRDAFGLATDWDRCTPVRFSNHDTESRLEAFLRFVSEHRADEIWLETAASAHFLVKAEGETNRDAIYSKIKAKQPHVTRKVFDRCWAELEAEHLL